MVTSIIAAVVGLAIGLGVGYVLWQNAMKKKTALMIAEAKKEAEQYKKDRGLEAKEKSSTRTPMTRSDVDGPDR